MLNLTHNFAHTHFTDHRQHFLLTVIIAIVAGAVDGAVRKDLEVPVLDVHLYLARGAGYVGEVGAPLAANCPVVLLIGRGGRRASGRQDDLVLVGRRVSPPRVSGPGYRHCH